MNYDLRKNHKSLPVQYQKGYVEFYKLKFKVTPDVLIPRPETELLVDEVLKFVHSSRLTVSSNNCELTKQSLRSKDLNQLTILDIGTGSGNIAISIAKNLPKQLPISDVGIQILAIDISEKALKIARKNAKLHEVEHKIKFIQSNLLSNAPRPEGICIIVTNLPYIPSARIPYLDSSVKDHEPHIALDGDEDGFKLYRKLFQQIQEKGWKPKLIIGEIDYTHGELALFEAQKYFPEAKVEVKKDLAHLQRILLIRQLL